MSPKFIVLIFAWISITALGIHVVSDVWIPLILGAIATAFLAVVLRK
jgi:hypothetical protein